MSNGGKKKKKGKTQKKEGVYGKEDMKQSLRMLHVPRPLQKKISQAFVANRESSKGDALAKAAVRLESLYKDRNTAEAFHNNSGRPANHPWRQEDISKIDTKINSLLQTHNLIDPPGTVLRVSRKNRYQR